MNRNLFHFGENKYSTKENSTQETDVEFSFPDYFTVGLAWEKSIKIYMDNELMIGKYGGKTLKDMEIWFLKLGVEKTYLNKLDLRAGINVPIMARTTTLGNLLDKIPDPKLNASCGIGYRWNKLTIDSAVFFNPGLSYAERKPVPDISISLSYNLFD